MKKPFVYALAAASYIIFIVNLIQTITQYVKEENLFIPMTMLGLFVLSVAVMGFLFFSEPLGLYLENRKQEALSFFGKMLGTFACFVIIFLGLLLFI